ncbi:3-oxo-5-alpha-steroid 4-dehydrogenase 1 [Coccomyxa sp. Obi]|nr:3-oxo-5-alpha-steroid 4-dehydrogenase 1 [Coccomyxa sp. Obi]
MIAQGIMTFLLLTVGKLYAGYGRYSHKTTRFYLNAKIAWMTQEMWSAIIPAAALLHALQRGQQLSPVQALLFAMFLMHYTWRSFAYPWMQRGGKPMPVYIWLMASAFCMFNGYLQGHGILQKGAEGSNQRIGMRHALGLSTWAAGWAVNLHSDHILRNLRQPGESGYRIPRGGAFEWVSGANYLGEIVEWAGFAAAAGSLPAAAFAFFTLCNIGPRAWHHHQWYKKQFDDYPRNRRALIPFVL